VNCSPKTLFTDVERVADLAMMDKALSPSRRLVVKLNLSWSKFFPSCSTSPYVFDACIAALLKRGFTPKNIIVTENETVVTNIDEGLRNNCWNKVIEKYHLVFKPLTQANWVEIQPSKETLALEDLFGEVIAPDFVVGSDVLHLPTVKSHGHTMMTGALKDAFGLFLRKNRHKTHLKIHEVLADLFALRKEICGNAFAITDGTIIGDGAGPRTMMPKLANILLASNDLVALDLVQCLIMGIDPAKVKVLSIIEQLGLGTTDQQQLKIVGDYSSPRELPNFQCTTKRSPVIKYDRIFRSSVLRKLLFETPLLALPIAASKIYHDYYWYPFKGRKYINWFLRETSWGQLFRSYRP